MKTAKFVVLQMTTIYLHIPGRKNHDDVIELSELNSHPSEGPHRHCSTTADLLCDQHTINRGPKSLGWCQLEHGFWYLISTIEWRRKKRFHALPWETIFRYPAFRVKNALALVFHKNFHKYLMAVFLHTSNTAFFTNIGCSREKRLFSSIFRN